MLMNTQTHYGLVARALHWLTAVLVVGMLLGGKTAALLPSGGFRSMIVAGHQSIGAVILVMTIGRLLWRRFNPRPRFLSPNALFNYMAHVLHVMLYILLIVQPLTGILMSQAHGYPVAVFGMFTLPPLVWQNAALGGFFRDVHGVSALLLTLGIIVHVAAALKHHWLDRDRTLTRMLTGR